MFKKEMKIVEIREGGITITHYLKGNKKDINRDIEKAKNISKKYEMMGKKGMIIWT